MTGATRARAARRRSPSASRPDALCRRGVPWVNWLRLLDPDPDMCTHPLTPRARAHAVLVLLALPVLGSCVAIAANRERARNADARDADVDREFELMLGALARNGWEPAGTSQRGHLEETYDESDDVYFDIPATGEWGVVGVCDRTCSDLDLELFDDRSGRRIAGDSEPDARPSIRFRADAGDRVRVRVTAPGCRVNESDQRSRQMSGLEDAKWFCRYGIQLVGR